MSAPSCKDCRYQLFRPATGPNGDKQSYGHCGMHNVGSLFARTRWFSDEFNLVESDENCGPSGKLWEARS